MTVAELILKLQKLNQQTKICFEDSYYGNSEVCDVYQTKQKGELIMVITGEKVLND